MDVLVDSLAEGEWRIIWRAVEKEEEEEKPFERQKKSDRET